MWKISLLLLIIYGGLTEANSICDEHDLRRCYPSHMGGVSFPENEEDLNKLCPVMISYMSCLKTYAEECGIENSVIIVVVEERLDRYNQVTIEACDQSSDLHHDITENLGCLKSVFINHRNSCSWTETVMDNSKQYLHTEEKSADQMVIKDEEDSIDWDKFFCLHRALDLACLASDASEKCGSSAKHLILETFRKLGHLEVPCTDESREELVELLNFLEIQTDSKIILKEILEDGY